MVLVWESVLMIVMGRFGIWWSGKVYSVASNRKSNPNGLKQLKKNLTAYVTGQ